MVDSELFSDKQAIRCFSLRFCNISQCYKVLCPNVSKPWCDAFIKKTKQQMGSDITDIMSCKQIQLFFFYISQHRMTVWSCRTMIVTVYDAALGANIKLFITVPKRREFWSIIHRRGTYKKLNAQKASVPLLISQIHRRPVHKTSTAKK